MVDVQRSFVPTECECRDGQFGGNSLGRLSTLGSEEGGGGGVDRLGEVVRFSNDGTDYVGVVREEGTGLNRSMRFYYELLSVVSEHWRRFTSATVVLCEMISACTD